MGGAWVAPLVKHRNFQFRSRSQGRDIEPRAQHGVCLRVSLPLLRLSAHALSLSDK